MGKGAKVMGLPLAAHLNVQRPIADDHEGELIGTCGEIEGAAVGVGEVHRLEQHHFEKLVEVALGGEADADRNHVVQEIVGALLLEFDAAQRRAFMIAQAFTLQRRGDPRLEQGRVEGLGR
jgi:hypothetical protein